MEQFVDEFLNLGVGPIVPIEQRADLHLEFEELVEDPR